MREVHASLPALGAFRVHLHRESKQVAEFFGEDEWARLGRIDHLGVATAAFPGINHTRLEYALLQCAIAQLIGKLYKDNKDLALSNAVQLDGLAKPVSSGEELLKSWALLSNCGHANWTFGTERALLDAALRDDGLRSWLLSGAVEQDLSEWANLVLDEYRDSEVRFLLVLLRIRENRPHDRRKHLFRQLLRNFVLDTSALTFPNPAHREKLYRLRILASRVRLLSMVTLDAYHSHSPVRLQLLPAIQELAESSVKTSGFDKFLSVLEATAGWLADEVYQHPSAVATQREYEIRGAKKAVSRFKKVEADPAARKQFLRQVVADGFGQPRLRKLAPLCRLTIEGLEDRLLGGGNRYERIEELNREIAVAPATLVSLTTNPFLRATQLDVLFRPGAADPTTIGKTFERLARWLLTAIEARSLDIVRRFLDPHGRDPDRVEATRVRTLRRRLGQSEPHLFEVFISLISHLVQPGWTVATEDYSEASLAHPLAWSVKDSKGVSYDFSENRFHRLKAGLRAIGDEARLFEVEALERLVRRRDRQLVLAILHPVVIRDHFGRKKDEWDGALLEIDDGFVRLTVLEAKGTGNIGQRAELAYQQLAETRSILKNRYPIVTRRRRLRNAGAYLVCNIWHRDA